MPKNNCLARQYSDQMACDACGLVWDMNDPEPPTCGKVDKRTKRVREAIASTAPCKLPIDLPEDVAVDMLRAFKAHAKDGIKGQLVGMRFAYRVLLDRIEP